MGILDFLNQYLAPEDTSQVPMDQFPSTSPTPPVEPQKPSVPFDYGNTFLRTPADEGQAKAAEEIRNLLYPKEMQPPVMSQMSAEQQAAPVKLQDTVKTAPTKPMAPKATSKPKSDPEADALKEMEAEVGDETSVKAPIVPEGPKEDLELKAAQEDRRRNLLLTNLAEAASGIGTAVASHGQQTLDPNAFKNLRDQAGLKVSEVKEKREAQENEIKKRQSLLATAKNEVELQSDQAKRDPDSDVSKMFREVIGQAMPELKIPPKISAFELEKLVGPLQNAANMKLAMESKKEMAQIAADARKAASDERKVRQDQRQEDVTFKEEERYQKQLSSIDAKHREATKYMDEANAFAEQATTNPQAAMNLARSVIKAVEGAGARVSDKDFTTAVGDASLGGSLMNTLNKLKSGTIRGITKDQVIQMLNASKEIQSNKYKESVKTEVERFAKRAKTTPEQAADLGVVSRDVLQHGKTIIKKEYSESRKQTRITYSDGSQEVVDGQK